MAVTTTDLLFLRCNQSEESWHKRRAGLRKRGAETCLSRQTLQKRTQEGEGWKVKPRWELSDRVGFKKRIKVCRLQLSCWVYELSRSFWAEWKKRWGHLVSFSPALESFIQRTCAALQRLTDKSLANERAVSLSVPPLARHIWFQNNNMMMMMKIISRLQKPAGDITVATSIFSSG